MKGIKKPKLLDEQGVSVWRAARMQGGRLFQGARLLAIAAEFLSLSGAPS